MEANCAALIDCCIGLVADDKLWQDGKHVVPTLEPLYWIAPVPFRCQSNLGQRHSVIGLGSRDVHQGEYGVMTNIRERPPLIGPGDWRLPIQMPITFP